MEKKKKKKTQYQNTLIKVIKKRAKIQQERERVLIVFLWEKYGLNGRNDIKFIQIK